ncbi:MAG: 50S ribosomal protein L3 [Gemmatimonadota bacterium]|nr:MAG: 50S ribosomal protein L3 [Gemmatimonadota bacterium]
MNGIIGRKIGMTRLFKEDGQVIPVTVIEAGPCPVVQVQEGSRGSKAVQLGFGARKPKRVNKALEGHVRGANLDVTPAVLKSIPLAEGAEAAPGDVVTVEIFEPGDRIKITGKTKGRGFQGVVKRYGFRGGPATHGSTRYRNPGSMGAGTDPSRVIKGKRLPGQMGAVRHTEMGLSVAKVDPERNLLYVKGAVPGPIKGIVLVRKQEGGSRYA